MRLRSVEEIQEDSIEAGMEDSVFIRILEFGFKYSDGFNRDDIVSALSLEEWELAIVDRYLENAYRNTIHAGIPSQSTSLESPFLATKATNATSFKDPYNRYIVSFDAHFQYFDYRELKLARENAKEAKRLSLWAIRLSVIAVIVSAVVPFLVAQWITQTVEILK